MRKIDIIDCENFEHKISLIIKEYRLEFVDSIYYALSGRTLSKGQAKKLQDFEMSCNGPIMVPNYYYYYNSMDIIAEKDLIFAYRTEKYIHVEWGTNIQGDRPCAYRIPVHDYKGFEDLLEKIHMMCFYGDDKRGTLERIWTGTKVY